VGNRRNALVRGLHSASEGVSRTHQDRFPRTRPGGMRQGIRSGCRRRRGPTPSRPQRGSELGGFRDGGGAVLPQVDLAYADKVDADPVLAGGGDCGRSAEDTLHAPPDTEVVLVDAGDPGRFVASVLTDRGVAVRALRRAREAGIREELPGVGGRHARRRRRGDDRDKTTRQRHEHRSPGGHSGSTATAHRVPSNTWPPCRQFTGHVIHETGPRLYGPAVSHRLRHQSERWLLH
jgi:hypothetical protein